MIDLKGVETIMMSDTYAEEFGYRVMRTEDSCAVCEARALRESGLDYVTVHEPEPQLTLTWWEIE